MKRMITIAVAGALALAAPALADDGQQAPDNAAQQCNAEGMPDPGAFLAKYGTNHNGRNAFGKCVSGKVSDQQGS